MSDWKVIRSIGIEHRGEDQLVREVGKISEVIPGVSETVLTIVGGVDAETIDTIELNGTRFMREK